ncbi:hypothetical protein SLS58_004635 [Diplodia intermedia]|uniref:Fe2OG dioxygenase domain-containing protein n=1 Tax=Diplodia intermedia TaxID=856260 RepID=A0ABR3TTH5_9PEZI
MSAFTTIPTLDLSQALLPETKPRLLEQLRHAVIEVGMLYVCNTGISPDLVEQVKEQCVAFFDQPLEKKLEIELANVPSFLGYTRQLGTEMTAGAVDWREHLSLSTQHPPPSPDEPLYRNLLGPNQWPDPASLPRFREVYERYLADMSQLSTRFTALIAEALGLDAGAFDRYFDEHQQHRLKIIKYPDLSRPKQQQEQEQEQERELAKNEQALGAHKDSQVMTFILQASPHRSLQAQNGAGAWLDVPPVDGTFVVAVGQGLEAMAHGVCAAATHRVLPPAPAGAGDRYSLAFIKSVSLDLQLRAADMPAGLMRLRRELAERCPERGDEVGRLYGDGKWADVGEQSLLHRIRSHPDVAQRWYPDIWKSVAPQVAAGTV